MSNVPPSPLGPDSNPTPSPMAAFRTPAYHPYSYTNAVDAKRKQLRDKEEELERRAQRMTEQDIAMARRSRALDQRDEALTRFGAASRRTMFFALCIAGLNIIGILSTVLRWTIGG